MRAYTASIQQRLLVFAQLPQISDELRGALDAIPDVVVMEEVHTSADALAYCASRAPDLVLVVTDWSSDPLGDIQALHQRHPNLGVVMVSPQTSRLRVAAAFAAGVRGYVMFEGSCNLPGVLGLVANGGFGCCAATTRQLSDTLTTHQSLSQREQLVAAHIAAGESNNDIAVSLGIKLPTVVTHVERILRKIGGRSRVDIATWWLMREGLPSR